MSPPVSETSESAMTCIDPKVSVLMITYNHEKFIAQAIESVLMQKTNFGVELVIGEDCSTDRTREIVLDFARRYPTRIRPLLPERNLGMHQNFVQTYQACRGAYVAVVEGDDYWTASDKLQKQVDLLDAHPEHSAAAHNALRFNEEEDRAQGNYCYLPAQSLPLEKMLITDWLPTCSVVLRRRVIGEFPDWFFTLYACDWSVLILCAEQGSIAYSDEVMAVYRQHNNGLWTGITRIRQLQAMIKARTAFDAYLKSRHKDVSQSMIASDFYDLAEVYEKSGEMGNARKSLRQCILADPRRALKLYRPIARLLMRLHTPQAYKIVRGIRLAIRPLLRPQKKAEL